MKKLLLGVSLLAISACGQEATETQDKPADQNKASTLAQGNIITDGHIDVPYRLDHEYQDVSVATATGDFDHPRAVKGGLNAPFMSIYTPAELDGSSDATDHANKMIDIVEKMVTDAPDKFVIAKSVADVHAAFKAGKIALPLGMENGSPIDGSLDQLDKFYERGIRYITLAHSKSNRISDSSYDETRQWDGLSAFGEKVVTRMNELGIMVDISHVSDAAFYDVMAMTDVPAIASHSSARHFTPGFERNMNDDMIKKLAEKNGVIMINYGSSFLTAEANGYGKLRDAAYDAMLLVKGIEGTDDLEDAFRTEFRVANPYPYADISDVLDHIDHVVKLTGGTDHVALGSDYDGVGDSLPTGLKDVSSYTPLTQGLIDRGYADGDIIKILGGNTLRVWKAVEDAAKK